MFIKLHGYTDNAEILIRPEEIQMLEENDPSGRDTDCRANVLLAKRHGCIGVKESIREIEKLIQLSTQPQELSTCL